MPTTLELREQRANIWEQMKAVLDESDSLTAEDQKKYEDAEKDLDRLTSEIDLRERHEATNARLNTVDRSGVPAPQAADELDDADALYNSAFKGFVTNGMAELDPEQRKALRSRFQLDQPRNAAGIGSGSAGGYLVPQGFRETIIERMKDYGAVQRVATVLNTSTGAPLPWPTNDDTSNVGALLAENSQASEQDITLGTEQLGAYKYTSKIVRVSLEFLQDVDWLDTETFIGRKFGQRVGRITNQHFTTGTGSSQPQGIVTGATSGVTAAGTSAITADELLDLIHSVDPAYRNAGNVRFMLSDTALKGLRKLKDGQSRYLWEPSVQAGVAPNLFGYEYVINQDMAVPATGVKSILFGDFEAGYVVRFVKAFELIRLDERYADYGQVGFIGFARADGLVQDSYAYRALTQA